VLKTVSTKNLWEMAKRACYTPFSSGCSKAIYSVVRVLDNTDNADVRRNMIYF
jgi:hypothetical protein